MDLIGLGHHRGAQGRGDHRDIESCGGRGGHCLWRDLTGGSKNGESATTGARLRRSNSGLSRGVGGLHVNGSRGCHRVIKQSLSGNCRTRRFTKNLTDSAVEKALGDSEGHVATNHRYTEARECDGEGDSPCQKRCPP